MANLKHRDLTATLHVKKATTSVPSSFSPQFNPLRSSDETSKVNDDCGNLESSSLIKSQIPFDHNSFKLWSHSSAPVTSETRFKEDVVSLRKFLRTEENQFLDIGASASWPMKCRGRCTLEELIEGSDAGQVECDDRFLGYEKKETVHGQFSNDCYTFSSNRFEDRTLSRLNILDDGPAQGNFLISSSSCWPHRFDGGAFSIWSSVEGSDPFAAICADRNLPEYKERLTKCSLEGEAAFSSYTWCDTDYGISLDKKRLSALINLEDLSESNCQIDFEIRREPWTHFVGLDVDKLNFVRNFCRASADLELDVFSLPSNLWTKHSWHSLENTVAPRHLCSSKFSNSLLIMPSSSSVSNSLVHMPYYIHQNHDLGRHHCEDEELSVTEPVHDQLTLPYTPKEINLGKGCSFHKLFKGISFSLPPQDHNWFVENMVDERTHPAREALLLPFSLYSDWD
ncbi:hypothetical protein Nepgr_004374 [Nepenthes gracilis]|uniref:Uncharacterized protein n=1 Tax=Nepenthes gracilis TaxID=150966 RepID=A0AAD3XF55_NEPGR|nr:hypothetical protein Nepgr_004374 [Nepenthes gracilis]